MQSSTTEQHAVPSPRRARRSLARLGLLAAAGSLVATGVTVSVAGAASTHSTKVAHASSGSGSSLSSLESELTSLEKPPSGSTPIGCAALGPSGSPKAFVRFRFSA